MSKKLGIIGAGPSGLVSAKEALEEGFKIKLFEKNSSFGGVWNQDCGMTWSSMKTNISKFTTSFSENPWDDSVSLFPKSSEVFQYLKAYSEKYSILKHIEFKTSVISIYENEKSWKVKVFNIETKESNLYDFDYVIIATGIFCKPFYPHFHKTVSNFKGLAIHSQFYKREKKSMQKKSIAIIGSSFSSSEIASDLVDYAANVTTIIRKPYWIVQRYIEKENNYKLPIDFLFYSQKSNFLRKETEKIDPIKADKSKHDFFSRICHKQNQISSLKVNSNPNDALKITVSDTFLEHVIENKINVRQGNVSHFTENGLSLTDGTVLNSDVVIYCSGYLAGLDFFGEDIKNKLEFDENDQLQPIILYKCTFHPELKNLAFVGMYRGPYFGVIELQARWAVRTFKKRINFTSLEKMTEGIEYERSIRKKKPRPQFPHNYIELANSIAEEMNLMPDFENLKENDPEVFDILWEGVTIPDFYKFNESKELAINSIKKVNEKIIELKNIKSHK